MCEGRGEGQSACVRGGEKGTECVIVREGCLQLVCEGRGWYVGEGVVGSYYLENCLQIPQENLRVVTPSS